jgi:hypothetical protein
MTERNRSGGTPMLTVRARVVGRVLARAWAGVSRRPPVARAMIEPPRTTFMNSRWTVKVRSKRASNIPHGAGMVTRGGARAAGSMPYRPPDGFCRRESGRVRRTGRSTRWHTIFRRMQPERIFGLGPSFVAGKKPRGHSGTVLRGRGVATWTPSQKAAVCGRGPMARSRVRLPARPQYPLVRVLPGPADRHNMHMVPLTEFILSSWVMRNGQYLNLPLSK